MENYGTAFDPTTPLDQPDVRIITNDTIRAAEADLQRFKQGKMNLETRIVQNEEWWKLRHGERTRSDQSLPETASAWLFNSILNKHADAMDNYPEPLVIPREPSDEATAETLSAVLPVILEQNAFDAVYSDAWWYKLKTGTAVYGVFWNPRRLNGLGDIEIRKVDLLNLFWEPGITDLQKSRQVFHVELVPNDILKAQYPQLSDRIGGGSGPVQPYHTADMVDDSQKTPVVDWYYKTTQNGVTRLHFAKFAVGELLYASENDPEMADRGFYDHGRYPFVFDVLFPQEGSPAGFGYVDIMKSPQTAIDQLGAVMLKNTRMSGKKRFFVRLDGSVNEAEFADWDKDFVHVSGNLGEDSIREIRVESLQGSVLSMYQAKIEELKETSGNRDFSQGSTASGVTAASAIAALQEAGSKLSRDMIKSSYRAFTQICELAIELIRQFYDMPRCFRITGGGETDYVSFSNAAMQPQNAGGLPGIPGGMNPMLPGMPGMMGGGALPGRNAAPLMAPGMATAPGASPGMQSGAQGNIPSLIRALTAKTASGGAPEDLGAGKEAGEKPLSRKGEGLSAVAEGQMAPQLSPNQPQENELPAGLPGLGGARGLPPMSGMGGIPSGLQGAGGISAGMNPLSGTAPALPGIGGMPPMGGLSPAMRSDPFTRLPIFDVRVKPQRTSPYSRLAQNELAREFYQLGFFNPAMSDQALACLSMMDFDGREKMRHEIEKNGTLFKEVQTLREQMMKMATVIDMQNGSGLSPVMGAAFGSQAPGAKKKAPKGKGKAGEGAQPGGGMGGMGAMGGGGFPGAGPAAGYPGAGGFPAQGAASGPATAPIQPAQEIAARVRQKVAGRGE